MTEVKELGPLDYRIAITDQQGRPSPEFQRRWDAQRVNNGLFVTLTFGTGAPTDSAARDGSEYIDMSTTPYTFYVVRTGVWHKVGPYAFTDLSDVPNTYSGAGLKLVRVNAGATALEFSTIAAALDSIGSVQGDILYRNATGWTVLPPGTASQLLQTGGASANPSWVNAPISLPSIANNTLLANTSGSAAVPVSTTLTALIDSALGSAQGDIIYRSASGWVVLTPGTSGYLLATGGASANPSWTAPIAAANPTATASDTAVNGSATTFMRSDASPAIQKGSSSQFGVVKVDGTTITSSSGVISALGTGTVTHTGTLTSGQLIKGNGSADITVGDLTGDVTTSGSMATTLATVATAGTNTKITYNAKGLVTSGVAATLASADFANQGTTTTVLHGNAAGNPAWSAVVEGDQSLSDVTTANVSSTKHGYAPKSPADATQFLNGATTPAYAAVKDSDLSTSDITTNNVSTSKHGFAPKLPNDATKYLDGTGAYSVPSGGGGGGGGSAPFAPWTIPLVASFTSTNAGSITFSDTTKGILFNIPSGLAFQPRGLMQTAPSAPWNLYCHMNFGVVGHNSNSRIGLTVQNTTSGKISQLGVMTFADGSHRSSILHWNSTSSYSSDSTAWAYGGAGLWMRLENDGTNLNLYFGDGYVWTLVRTETIASWVGTINNIGVMVQIDTPSLFFINSYSFTAPVSGGGGPES